MVFEAAYTTKAGYEIPVYAEVEIDEFGDVDEVFWFYAKNHKPIQGKLAETLTERYQDIIIEQASEFENDEEDKIENE